MNDTARQTVVRLKDFRDDTEGFVRANPWQAVGVVALIGVVTGVLASRRARRRAAYGAQGAASELAGG